MSGVKSQLVEDLGVARCVVVDTNLLVLDAVGRVDPNGISKHKRTSAFTLEDWNLLQEGLGAIREMVVTPHVLAETSNLLDEDRLRSAMLERARGLREEHLALDWLVFTRRLGSIVLRLGVTDGVLVELSTRGVVVLTTDHKLHAAILECDGDGVNFNHYRRV
jgi:rRNA-processing protein FCF1